MNYKNRQYWLVEANWIGGQSHTDRFISEGVWMNIHSNKTAEFKKIKENDYIAVKASFTKQISDTHYISGILVKAKGIVLKDSQDGRKLEVEWERLEEPLEITNITKDDSIHKIIDKQEIKNIFFPNEEEFNFPFHEELEEILEQVKVPIEEGIILAPKEDTITLLNTDNSIKNKDFPLNRIFYGASGSGKTFKAICTALEIIDGFYPEDVKEIKNRFNYYKSLGQISAVTFHDSFKYDDFIEGLKLTISEENKTKTEYKVTNGLFKEICNLANVDIQKDTNPIDLSNNKERFRFFKLSLGTTSQEKDDKTLHYCFDNNMISLDMLGGIDYSIIEDTEDWDLAKEELEKAYLYDGHDDDKKRLGIQSIFYFKNYMKTNDIVFISNDNKYIIGVARLTGRYEFRDIPGIRYYHFRKVEWIVKDCSIPIEKIYKIKFSELPIYELNRRNLIVDNILKIMGPEDQRKKNHVFIIDEINKGDIYKIFGEAITLIEPSKRLGADEELKLKLPHSGEEFGVPKNLYIIGTMNPSEKEIDLDKNIRRRFEFIYLDINYSILDFEIDNINIGNLLKKINDRIEYLLSKDYLIGHSYFFDLKARPSFELLKSIFEFKILPLLEYSFKNDYEKISLVLGDQNKKKESSKFIIKQKLNGKKLFGNKNSFKDKDLFTINIPRETIDYINI